MSSRDQEKLLAEIIARCWNDAAFKQRFISNPKEILLQSGIAVPKEVEIKVVENTDREYFITLPMAPRSSELTNAELESVAGGIIPTRLHQSWG